MPKCELCGEKVARRIKRLISKRLQMICNHCDYHILNGNHLYTISTLGSERAYGREMRKEVNRLNSLLEHKPLNEKKVYPYSNPWSAVPPIHVLMNAKKALSVQGIYSGFPEILGDYYGILSPPYYHNDKMVPEGAIACYYPHTNTVYSKNPMSNHTAFHEMYHALERHGIVPKTTDSEKNADFYADACCDLLNQKP